ncbi:run domain Beclin-1-interacting and cysteine-rich domain-containing protein [Procambarus clarkii]|uniref:run domain Beclin-1-interacting and cysteine-rich domain-containing protein n=1 Tax=Procambarus clarkii TaxID=6728 RepID=UPI001E6770E9|nr:run domain Beclin-1-interacting and cysteine-rich domain-containing protein-like [Procambarus clarkii]XP_045609722.1 run domain Beclin-1-interacting and cysteine-rich domain-containing protein-like [Procambarus clarkii]
MAEFLKGSMGLMQHKNASKSLVSKKEEFVRNEDDAEEILVTQRAEVESLLSELVNTVGAVLTSRPTQVWQLYGGFQRIYETVKNIFCHGCKHIDVQGNADMWPFVVGLRVLYPALGPCVKMTTTPRPADNWIHMSLEKLQLAAKIEALTSDRDHVEKHYHPWALMSSQDHVSAVITCLRALEENSQSILADINSRLLVGTYQPLPGTTTMPHNDSANQMGSRIRPRLCGINSADLMSKPDLLKRNTSSLPTSPVTEKECPTLFSQSNNQNKSLNKEIKKELDIVPSCSEVVKSLKNKEIGRSRDNTKPVNVNVESKDVTLMRRESPDGSSDCSDWPAMMSPVDQSIVFNTDESPRVSDGSTFSSISKLVHGKTIHILTSETGARPKELTPILQSDLHPVSFTEFLNVSDSGSGPGSTISPSLLQVNYGGECSTSDGDSSTTGSFQRSRGSQGFRTPQLRHRASTGRLTSLPADSDQDSEETVDGISSQIPRRRRRFPSTPQPSSLSVKLLTDSRGILKSDSNLEISCSNDCLRKGSEQSSSCDNLKSLVHKPVVSNASTNNNPSSVVPPSSELPQTTECPVVSTPCNFSKSVLPHVTSAPVSTNLSAEIIDNVAFSAPVRDFKGNLLASEEVKAKKKTHGRSRSDGSQELVGKLCLSQSNTVPELESKFKATKLGKTGDFGISAPVPVRKRFMEDGGHSITPAADNGFFPRPQPGQSLIGFLSSKEFHKQYAELDRENAHFNISEAVIAALTQMQFDAWQQKYSSSPGTGDESDEEIRSLQARIREKRRQKISGSVLSATTSTNTVIESISDPQKWASKSSGKLESTTDYSVYESPQSSAYNSESDMVSELEEELENDGSSSCEDTPILQSRTTSESEPSPFKTDLTSAENVALNLLKHFNEQRLPKACELEWLVSEQDVPQKLLPLPTSVAVSPDDSGAGKASLSQTQLRGTSDWAPPRPQLIFTLHTNTKRSVLMGGQGWRCAGCGMRVTERLSRHFRLCNYLGRYFCTTCHTNQTAMIPAKILHKWDFKLYPVAKFSSELIKSMRSDPLFNIDALNPGLYKRCRHLHQAYIYRLQLYRSLPYINTCSRSQSEKVMLSKTPPHWSGDPHAYSLDDLISVKAGLLVTELKSITSQCIVHIAKCQVCLGRGFICEVCGLGDAIFPFQLDSTALCNTCSACFHAGCFSPIRCPRCIRRETRRLSHGNLQLLNS